MSHTPPVDDSNIHRAVERILDALSLQNIAQNSARFLMYGTAAATIYAITQGNLTAVATVSPVIARLIETVGGDTLAGLIEKVVQDKDNALTSVDIQYMVEEAFAKVKPTDYLSEQEFYRAIRILEARDEQRHSDISNQYLQHQAQLESLNESVQALAEAIRHQDDDTEIRESANANIGSSGLTFANISMDATNPGWQEMTNLRGPFKIECKQNYLLRLSTYNVEPCFDITLMNSAKTPVVLTDIGVEIVSVAAITYVRGMPQAVKIKKVDTYVIEMPNVWEMVKRDRPQASAQIRAQTQTSSKRMTEDQPPSRAPSGATKITVEFADISIPDFPPTELGKLVTMKVPDPIYLEPQAPYRYGLLLSKYHKQMPNHAILRLWVRTNEREERSHEIHLQG